MVWEIVLCSVLSSGGLPPDLDFVSEVVPEVMEEVVIDEETSEVDIADSDSDNVDSEDSDVSTEVIIDYDYIVDNVVDGVVSAIADDDDFVSSDASVVVEGSEALLAAVGDIYNGTISTSILDYFDRLVVKLGNFSHYVLVRDAQYSYTLYYGDIALSGTVFSGDCDAVNITTYTGTSGYYAFSELSDVTLSLDASDYLVYSDLGMYPALGDSSLLPLFVILYVMILALLCVFLWRIWRFTLRGGGSYAQDGKDSSVVV